MAHSTALAAFVVCFATPVISASAAESVLPARPRAVPAAAARLPVARAGIVHGQVVDKQGGAPIAGAAVTVDGTTIGSTTDERGNYRLTGVPNGDRSLTVRWIGYAPVSRRVTVAEGADVTANFEVTKSTTTLDAIVTTATGDQRKLEIGNTVALLNADSLAVAAPITSFTDMIQGRVSGVLTFSNSGVTGSAPRIRIRGFNSLSQSNQPLMIIDGARVDNSTGGAAAGANNIPSYGWTAGANTALNPDEIESLEIVKGPAAATLYGTDAANGVIVIRTKRGRQGSAKLNVYTEGGVIEGPTKWNTNYYAFGHTPTGAQTNCTNLARIAAICVVDSVSHWNAMRDAASSPVGTGHRKLVGAQVSGGAQQFRYFFSGEGEDETGYLRLPQSEIARLSAERGGAAIPDEQIHPNYLDRVSLRGNVSTSIGTKAEVSISNGLQFQKSQIPGSGIFSDGAWGPGYKDAFDGFSGGRRPGEDFSIRSAENLTRITTSLNASWTPIPWLVTRATWGVDASSNFSDNLQRRGEGGTAAAPSLGRRAESRNSTTLYTGDVGASASFNVTSNLSSRTSVGGQFNRRNKGSVTATGTILPPGSSTLAGATTLTNTESTVQSVVAGGYVEETLGSRDRLFITGAVRADGASSFGKNFNTAFYPKVSLSWLASDEGFFPKSRFLNSLRYRLAYGTSGVQPSAVAALAQDQLSTVFVNGSTQSAAKLQALGNSNLKPEKTAEVETGIDADLWDSRIRLEATVYQKQSSDALVQRAYPRSVGIISTGQLDNVGAVRNRGVEATVSGQVFSMRGVGLDLSLNGSINQNVLTKLDPTLRPPEDRFVKFVEGYPLFGQWDHKVESYSDLNGNGILEQGEVVVGKDVTFLGNTNPTHLLNFTPTLSLLHGALRISSLFVYKGAWIQTNFSELNKCNIGGCQAKNDPKAPMRVQAAYIAFAGPTLTYAGYEEDGSFSRWAEASIVYDAGVHAARFLHGRRAIVTLSAKNLKLWTKYSGLDPEVAQNPELSGNFGTLWDLGYDNPVSPLPRYFILKVTLGM